MVRVESASSINTYKQCPRKYYYSYIEKLKTLPNIYCLRGNAIHSTLEEFFNLDISILSEGNYEFELAIIAHEIFKKEWGKRRKDLDKLGLENAKLEFFKKESQGMLNDWLRRFFKKLKEEQALHKKKEMSEKSFRESFEILRPETELYLESEKYQVRGYIDALHKIENKIILIDYKTSKRDGLTEEYKLQLAIYSLLYYDKFGKIPDRVGIDLLRHGERVIDVDDDLIEMAKKETLAMAGRTSSDKKEDYPIQKSRLCPWCDFKDICGK